MLVLPFLVSQTKAQEERYFFTVENLIQTGTPAQEKIALVIIEEFKKIGIKVTYDKVDGAVHNERIFKASIEGATSKTKGYDFFTVMWGFSAREDPSTLTFSFTSANRWPGGWNVLNYANPDVDELHLKGIATIDWKEREKIYSSVQKILAEDLPVIPIVMLQSPIAMRKDLVGVKVPTDRLSGVLGAFDWSRAGKPRGGTVRFAYNKELVGLLPYWGNIGAEAFHSEVWEQLVNFDENFNLVPELAKSWEIAPDLRSITFRLYENVTWHDGTKFTSKDVAFTFKALMDKETATTAWGRVNKYVESVSTPDDYTVVIRLKVAHAGIFADLLAGALSYFIVPEHILRNVPYPQWRFHDLNTKKPIGTGPYKFVEWVPQQYIKLTANDKYYRGRPFFDEKIGVLIPEAATAISALQKGDVDVLAEGYSLAIEQVDPIKNDPNIKIEFKYSPYKVTAQVNLKHPILGNNYVRKAMSAAIPRDRIAKEVFKGYAVPMENLWTKEMDKAYNASITAPKYDIAQAKRFMEMAGYSYAWLEPPPVTPVSVFLLYGVAGLVVGIVATFAVVKLRKK